STISLASGEQAVLSGSVTITGAGTGTGNGAFRWGLFNDTAAAGTSGPSAAWLGYLASNSSGGPNGRLDAKNPDATDWLTASHISTNSTANFEGNCMNGTANDGCGARVFNLAMGGGNDSFDDDTYNFKIFVGRYGDEVTVSATMQGTGPAPGDYNNDHVVNAADYTIWRDHLGQTFQLQNEGQGVTPGMVTQEDYNTWRANFGRTTGYTYNLGGGIDSNTLLPSSPPGGTAATTVTPHVTFDFNRVSLFFANQLQADKAVMAGVDVSKQSIQTLTLFVNPANGASTILNDPASSTQSFNMIYYEITSTAGSLVKANWTSFDSTEGGDPIGTGWDEAGGSGANVLSEINLNTNGQKTFGIGALANLGNIFNTAMAQDLRFFFLQADGSLVRGVVKYSAAPGAGNAAAVPEPGSFCLLSAGGLLLVTYRRRRRAN
ncbi:MAG TPA: PEP-CTERM sorting domain-containing protein, partial [Lacipirellulaceae bacterium]